MSIIVFTALKQMYYFVCFKTVKTFLQNYKALLYNLSFLIRLIFSLTVLMSFLIHRLVFLKLQNNTFCFKTLFVEKFCSF